MVPGYHKILGAVKKGGLTAISWGPGGVYEIVEKMKGKLLYCPAGILHNNDEGKKEGLQEDTGVVRRVILRLKGKRFRLDCGHHITFAQGMTSPF